MGIPFQPAFHYDAEVDTKFPQAFTGGVSLQGWRHSRINLQGQWIDWSAAFQQLPVKLTNGNNSDINGFLGSSSVQDTIPLRWGNQAMFGVGVEVPLAEAFEVRGGYSYATDPVPSSTLTPMTAAILQNTLTRGRATVTATTVSTWPIKCNCRPPSTWERVNCSPENTTIAR